MVWPIGRMIAGAVLVAAGVAAGCALTESPEDRAADAARDKAVRVRDALGDRSLTRAADIGRAADELAEVEVMAVRGTLRSRGGVRLVIRVPGTAPTGWMSGQEITVRRCFALHFRDSMYDESGPEKVDCPDGPPRTFGPWPEPPEIPARVHERLRRTLPKVPRGGTVDVAKVRRAVDRLRLGPEIRTEIATENGVVGVSLQTGSGTSLECLMARVAPGSTQVWRPPRAQRMPGEAGCGVALAIHPLPPPH